MILNIIPEENHNNVPKSHIIRFGGAVTIKSKDFYFHTNEPFMIDCGKPIEFINLSYQIGYNFEKPNNKFFNKPKKKLQKMNANELMLGNYLQEIVLKRAGFVKSVGIIKINLKLEHSNLICSYDDVEPIPLTEKWLLDFGFNKDYKIGYVGKDFGNTDFVLTVPLTLGEWQKGYVFEFLSGGWSKFVEFNYVHELQNFYFTMTKSFLQLVEPK